MALSRSARMIILLVIDILMFLLEIVVGYLVGSLALIADSFHMLTDIISLLIALHAIQLAKRPPNDMYSYGWKRAEILAALINGIFLLSLCLSIVLQAIQRLLILSDVSKPLLMVIVGACGLVSNIFGMLLFHEHGHSHSHHDVEANPLPPADATLVDISSTTEHNVPSPPSGVVDQGGSHIAVDVDKRPVECSPAPPLLNRTSDSHSHGSMNMHSLMLHILGDAFGNISVIVTGLVIWRTTWSYRFRLDPVASIVISVVISCSAFSLVQKSSHILLQAVPRNVSLNAIRDSMLKIDGVKSVDEFHIWTLSESQNVATVHVTATSDCVMDVNFILHQNGLTSSSNTIQMHVTDDDVKAPVDSSVLGAQLQH